jgi:outer membrane protein assembly factor BamB
MAVGETFFNNGLGFNSANGEKAITLGAGPLAAIPDGLIRADGKKLEVYRWVDVEQPDRKGQPVRKRSLERAWSVDDITNTTSLIVADDKIVCGANGQVTMIDMTTKNAVWSGKVDGTVYGLAAADGKLLASTDRGLIYCFDGTAEVASWDAQGDPGIVPKTKEQYARAAEEIIQLGGISEGYCLDLGCGDGSLACELARRTELQICAVDDDPAMVAAARQKLMAAGIYGVQVTVQQRDLKATDYPQYFANLIVSGRSVDDGGSSLAMAEARRLQRPFGGAICIGRLGKMKVEKRGPLAGAGTWTHQYADAANTLVSDDTLVGGRLSMLWFRDVDFDIPSRHGRAPAPLYDRGRLFHEGNDGIVAVDAYNGHELWRYEIQGLLKAYDGDELMGVAGTGSNCCVGGDSVYVRDGKRCLKLNAATGTLLREFQPPPRPDGQPGTWGYVAWVDNVLYGTVAIDEHVVTYRYRATTGDMSRLLTESHSLFAMDAETGDLIWIYEATDSIRHNAIAIGNGKVFLIDRPMAMFDREKRPQSKEHPSGRLLALDAKTGEQTWADDADIYGTMLAVSEKHHVLLMSYQPTRFRLDSEFGGRMTAFKTKDGQKLWEIKADYASRPMIHDGTIYAQGGAWNLLSGELGTFNFKRSYGCGILAASKNMMLFRSATLGYFDIERNNGVDNYGGIRPGCWVNALPAGGLVLLPDATAGCGCSYLNKAWIALAPPEK